MSQPDLRLAYLIANKDLLTIEQAEETILRAFAASFCDNDDSSPEVAKIVITNLLNCLNQLRQYEYEQLSDINEEYPAPETLTGTVAETYYLQLISDRYKANGYDKLYAEEIASWPDALDLKADYSRDLLERFADLEVGHDLIVSDYLKAAFGKNGGTPSGSAK